jgi:ribosomal protein L16 Arg81 hydroxylase
VQCTQRSIQQRLALCQRQQAIAPVFPVPLTYYCSSNDLTAIDPGVQQAGNAFRQHCIRPVQFVTMLHMLATLLKPLTTEQFLREYWPDRCYASHGPLQRLPDILQCEVLSSFEKLARSYRGRVLFTRGRNSPYMIPAGQTSAELLFRMGLTVYLDDIASCMPDAGAFLATLEQDFGIQPGTARIGAFASPVTDGVAPHFDVEDVISIQLQGRKRFYVAPVQEVRYPTGMQYSPGDDPIDEQYPQITGAFPECQDANFECIDMQPGSVLFMPRGTWHRTEAEAASLAVSIILKPPAAADTLLEQIRCLLLQQPRWRKPLYGAWGTGTRREQALTDATALISELPAILKSLDHSALQTALASEAQRMAAVHADSRLRRRPNARVETSTSTTQPGLTEVRVLVHSDESGEQVTVRMQVHPQAAAIFSWLGESHCAFTLREVQQQFNLFPLDQHIAIAQACIKAKLLRLLWFPALSA